MKLIKITLRDVKKAIKNNGVWEGYSCGNNINYYHIRNGWCLGVPVSWESEADIEKFKQNYFWYNSEFGNYLQYWQEV